jgi:hypothetical protein
LANKVEHTCLKMWCDKKSLKSSVSIETVLVTKHIPARNCNLSNRIVGCIRVNYLMSSLYAGVVLG